MQNAPSEAKQRLEVEPNPDDRFYVIGITNRYRLEGSPDPVMQFQDATLRHSEALVRDGLRIPDVVQVSVEIYSLSFTHRDLFEKYGAKTTGGIETDYYMSLYFVGESAMQQFIRHGIALPPTLGTVRRNELPERRGSPVPLGSRIWERAL